MPDAVLGAMVAACFGQDCPDLQAISETNLKVATQVTGPSGFVPALPGRCPAIPSTSVCRAPTHPFIPSPNVSSFPLEPLNMSLHGVLLSVCPSFPLLIKIQVIGLEPSPLQGSS